MIGYIPVVEMFSFELIAGYMIDANAEGSIATGFAHTRQIEVGAEYKNSDWNEIRIDMGNIGIIVTDDKYLQFFIRLESF